MSYRRRLVFGRSLTDSMWTSSRTIAAALVLSWALTASPLAGAASSSSTSTTTPAQSTVGTVQTGHTSKHSSELWQALSNATALAADDPSAAISAFRDLLLTEPDLHAAHYNLGCLLMNDEPEQAQRHFARATTAPMFSIERDSWLNLALLHHSQGRLAQAVAAADEATRLAPDDPDIASTRDELQRLLLEARDQARLEAMRPTLSTEPLPPAWEGQAYSAQLQGHGGLGEPYHFSLGDRGLPAGLSLAADGQISGSPDRGTAGTHQVTVTVAAADAHTQPASPNQTGAAPPTGLPGSGSASLRILPPPAITGSPLPRGFIDVGYSHQLSTEGMFAASWTITGLPDGLTLTPSSDGRSADLRGTPRVSGTFTLQVTARDAYHEQDLTLSLTIDADGFAPAQNRLPPATAWHPYQAKASVRGKAGTYSWSGSAGGLQLAADGSITGTPDEHGELVVPVTITRDDDQHQVHAELKVLVNMPPVVQTDQNIELQVGRAAKTTLRSEGGTGPLRWSIVSPPPPGLQVTDQGQLVGLPETPGEFTLTVAVSDHWQATSEGTLPVVISEPPPEGQPDQSQDGEQDGEGTESGEQGDQQDEQQDGEGTESGEQGDQQDEQQSQDGSNSQGDNDQAEADDSNAESDPTDRQGNSDQNQPGDESAPDSEPDSEPEQAGEDDNGTNAETTNNLANSGPSEEERAADADAQAERIDEATARRWLQQLPDEPSGIELFLLPDGVDSVESEEPW